MSFSLAYQRRLEIWQSDFGRDEGWYVELEGVRVAELVDCQGQQMFWDAYRIVPLENELGIRDQLFQRAFWDNSQLLTFRNRKFGDIAESAWPAAKVFDEEGRVVMRSLYLSISAPTWFDGWVLWWLKRKNHD